jgi:hypothetical protein
MVLSLGTLNLKISLKVRLSSPSHAVPSTKPAEAPVAGAFSNSSNLELLTSHFPAETLALSSLMVNQKDYEMLHYLY